ncbi:unnamed protein product, partial [Brassica oleracea var. botrytis]
WHAFEFVVVCTGKYGDVPRIPTFPAKKGPEIFKGKMMHSMDYCNFGFGSVQIVNVGTEKYPEKVWVSFGSGSGSDSSGNLDNLDIISYFGSVPVILPRPNCKLEKEEALDLLRGKKVAVIGFKKSAIDLALESALANRGIYTNT